LEGVPAFGEEFLEGGVVLDDPVVDQGDAGPLVLMGVGVGLGDPAVRRPAGVGEPEGALEAGHVLELLLQIANPPHGLGDLDRAVENRQPRGVIPAVLKPLEALEQQRAGGLGADVRDDSTHVIGPCSGAREPRAGGRAGRKTRLRRRESPRG
jgi:hypothetical protein